MAGWLAGLVLWFPYLPGYAFLAAGLVSLVVVSLGLHLMAVGYFGNPQGRDKSKHPLHLPRVLVRDGHRGDGGMAGDGA